MENSGEAADDEGSGWFEVKKKNRSSSKFSLQSWVGGFSGKNASNHSSSRTSTSESSGYSRDKRRSQPPKIPGNYGVYSRGSDANSIAVPNEKKPGAPYHDICVIKQDTGCPKPPPSFVTNSDDGTIDAEKIPANDNSEVVAKIRWGDLEGDGLALPCANLVGAKIKFGAIGDDNLVVSSEHGNGHKFVSSTNLQKNTLVAESVDAKDQLCEDKCKEVNIISSEKAEEPILNKKKLDFDNSTSNCKDIDTEHVEVVADDSLSASPLAGEEAATVEKCQTPVVLPEVGDHEIPEVSVITGDSIEVHVSEDKGLIPPKRDHGISEVSTYTASDEDHEGTQCGMIHDMSNSQNMSALGECDTDESKERFRQRLWCFLFENLNRAVDELYLLCELECDVEQMKEAILVLEEAASDFRDLSTRVEDFEEIKRSSSQIIDGVPITLKSDHRRPHALSWEVRRMTTSAHKAEILSSSLEAFKKIQQERASLCATTDDKLLGPQYLNLRCVDKLNKLSAINDGKFNTKDSIKKSGKQNGGPDLAEADINGGKGNTESSCSSKTNLVQSARAPHNASSSVVNASRLPPRDSSAAGKTKSKQFGSEAERLLPKKDKLSTEGGVEKFPRLTDQSKKEIPLFEKDKEKRNSAPWKSMDAWKEKRNWENVLSSPSRVSSRVSRSPGMRRKSADRARMLHYKLMSPEKKKKTALDLKREAEEKHARALRIKSELDNERAQKLHRNSEKVYRASAFHVVRNMKLREGIYARHQRSESRHEAFLAQVVKRAGDESSKVNEVRFITSLNEENKKLSLRQKLHDSELRRAEKLQVIRTKQKEDMAREEAVLERRKLIEAEKLQRLAETQKRKEEALVRREEERKASSAAREARAMEQLRRKEERAKAQQEEAELLAQKLAERLSESEQRRKFYLEQIRERASMDFRDQSSPLFRRTLNKEGQGRSSSVNNGDEYQGANFSGLGGSTLVASNVTAQHSMKRRIKRIRQRLMALKYDFPEPPAGAENAGIGYRTAVGTARAKIGRWLQELKTLRQARKEGAASIGLIIAEMIKYLEGKEPELQASRQAGLLDFIASTLPASHTSKPEACQVTIHLLKLLRVVLSVPANRSYFLIQNLLPPIIPMLAAALESYIKMAVSLNLSANVNSLSSKTSAENFESMSEVLDGYLWTVTTIISHISSDERQLQMRDGLLELLIAYQVIQRLRDLFALYDRPQVEGSPFPSSILLSINLLVVLTSRSEINGSINWESVPIETMVGNGCEEAKFAERDSIEFLPITQSLGDSRPPFSFVNGGKAVHLLDVPEESPLNESCPINKSAESVSAIKDGEKEQSSSLVAGRNANTISTDVPDEPQKIPVMDIMEPLASQRDEKPLVVNGAEQKNENIVSAEQPVAFLLSAVSETGLVSLPSLLTSVLLQANNRLASEQTSDALPSNFEDVATGVLKVLNNLALLDLKFMQRMLARPDLKMEFFHLMSFLLSHCTSKWKAANDQVGFLLLESLLLLGHFALFHLGNQAVLRWGKSPTIIHKVCDLPFVFFSDPELMPILAGTLVAACYGCEQNKGVVQQEISTDMLLSLLRSCRNVLPSVKSNSNLDNSQADSVPLRSGRNNAKSTISTRLSSVKGGASGNSLRIGGKMKSHRESKATKSPGETAEKDNLPVSDTSSVMLHSRFPISFIDRAEDFFSTGTPGVDEV